VSEAVPDRVAGVLEEVDPELVAIFLEEAEELLDQIDQAVQSCVEGSDVQGAIEALLRALHTLKGGARLAGLAAAGDAAHEFESWLIATRDGAQPFDSQAVAHLHDRYDGLAALIGAASGASVPRTELRLEPSAAAETVTGAEFVEPIARMFRSPLLNLTTWPTQRRCSTRRRSKRQARWRRSPTQRNPGSCRLPSRG
jgi:chemotaxis protein histidine kinase CheA